jgi:CBS domain-containing protein
MIIQGAAMSVGQICSRVVVTAVPRETVRVAAHRMSVNDVGTLVVVDAADPSQPIGIVTDRDIAMRCVAGELDPDTTQLSEVMTKPVETIAEDAPIEDAINRMAAIGLRRLIVTGQAHTRAGVVSLDDVLEHLMRELQPLGRLLDQQQPRIPA